MLCRQTGAGTRLRTGALSTVIPAYAGIQNLTPVCHPNAAAASGTPASAGVTKAIVFKRLERRGGFYRSGPLACWRVL